MPDLASNHDWAIAVKCQLRARACHLDERFDHRSTATLTALVVPGPVAGRHLTAQK